MTKEQLSELRKACTDSPSMDGFEISANDILWLVDQVENKDLNAFKAGAEWAAQQVPQHFCESHDRDYAKRTTRDNILTAAANLKELPQ